MIFDRIRGPIAHAGGRPDDIWRCNMANVCRVFKGTEETFSEVTDEPIQAQLVCKSKG